jgi:hypothetical protein
MFGTSEGQLMAAGLLRYVANSDTEPGSFS